jgi:hypothetical protein
MAVAALRAGAVGALPPKVLLGLEAPDVEPFHTGEPEGVEEIAVGEEKVQAGVSAVLDDPTHGFPDAGEGVRGLPYMVAEEGEVSLGVGSTLEWAHSDRKVLQTLDVAVVGEDEGVMGEGLGVLRTGLALGSVADVGHEEVGADSASLGGELPVPMGGDRCFSTTGRRPT